MIKKWGIWNFSSQNLLSLGPSLSAGIPGSLPAQSLG